MSEPTNEEILPQDANGDETPPARKTAARKTTAKKAAKKAARKTAKKAAKKTAGKAAAKEPSPMEETPELFDQVGESGPEKPAHEAEAASPAAENPPSDETPEPKRFGRVPGGGPVAPREAAAAPVPSEDPAANPPGTDGPPKRESRSKRRRDKRKRRAERLAHMRADGTDAGPAEPRQANLSGPRIEADGMLELAPKGFGFLRVSSKNFEQARDDVFVPPELIRRHNLRVGQWIHGLYQEGSRGPQLVEITTINELTPDEAAKLPHFDELKAINPTKRISFETEPNRFTTRVLDIMAPVGRGQRGLIVSPPRSGKTTLLLHLAEAVREKYEDTLHLMVLLVDERPEEVTEFRRALPGAEIYASSNDEQPRNHCRMAELAIERAKRLVEAGKDVFLLMDSITRLARAYNNTMGRRGRATGSGGITIGALEVPRRLFAAARNTRGGGSLTILATALIQTNSRADEAIFMEFKGTGNMELVLDRKIAENYIYPAVDIFKSGTRREELLIPEHMLHKIHLIRRGLSGHRPVEAMERLLFFQKKFPNNPQMLLEIKG